MTYRLKVALMSDVTLYDQLGGEAAISAVVDRFYERVLADDELVEYFEDADMDALHRHQEEFFSSVTGGPVEYDGATMQAAHDHLGITHEDFGRVATHLQAALEECGVEDDHVDDVMAAVASLEDDIVTA